MTSMVNHLPYFQKSVDGDGLLTRIRAVGRVTTHDLVHFAEHNGHHQRTPLVLWDLRKASWCDIKTQELTNSLEAARKFASADYRTAFILGSDADYGLGRILETYTEAREFLGEYRPFRALKDAEEWLLSSSAMAQSASHTNGIDRLSPF